MKVADNDSLLGERLVLPVLPLRDVVVFPHVVIPPLRRPREVDLRPRPGDEGRQADHAHRAEGRGGGGSFRRKPLRRRGGGEHPANSCGCPTTRSRCWSKAPNVRVSRGTSRPRPTSRRRSTCSGRRCRPVASWRRSAARCSRSSSSTSRSTARCRRKSSPRSPGSTTRPGSPTPSSPTSGSRRRRSRRSSRWWRPASAWSGSSPRCRRRWSSCRSRSASAGGSSARWKRASASTT